MDKETTFVSLPFGAGIPIILRNIFWILSVFQYCVDLRPLMKKNPITSVLLGNTKRFLKCTDGWVV